MKKILLKGYYGFGNFGDDLLLIVAWNIIRESYPQSKIKVFSNFNERLPGYNQYEGYNRYIGKLLGEDVELIDWKDKEFFDIVFHGGGGIYFDHRRGSYFTEIVNRIVRFLGASASRQMEILIRKLTGRDERIRFKERVGAGIGIGEFALGASSFFRKLSEIGSYSLLLVRDHYSLMQLNRFGFKGEKGEYSDLVFLYQYWNRLVQAKPKPAPDTIGLILMDWEGSGSRLKKFKNFEREISARGYQVRWFSFDENHDRAYVREMCEHTLHMWQPNHIPVDDYLKSLAECDIIVTMRAHGAIAGACLGAIPVCINTSKKLEQVSEMFPGSASLIDDDFSVNDLLLEVERISDSWEDMCSMLINDVSNNHEKMKKGVKVLMKHFHG